MSTDNFIGNIYQQNCGDSLLVLEKTERRQYITKGEFLYRCQFQKYPYEIFVRKGKVLSGSCLNPQIEKVEFVDKIWKQNCGDSLKIIKKDKKPGYWCVEFINYPYLTTASKHEIKKGSVFNPKIEQKDFIGHIFKQNCGDSLLVLEKTDKTDSSGAFLFKAKFLSDNSIKLVHKKNILRGIVDNKNFINKEKFPWRDKETLFSIIKSFSKKPTIIEICDKVKCSYSVINKAINEYSLQNYINYNYSFKENKIKLYIENLLNIEIPNFNTKYPKYYEIDIYIPNLKLGIEYNGNLWHSNHEKFGVSNNYHQEKSLYFKEEGIEIFHIFEYEWLEKQNICEALIKSKLGIFDKKIGARKCQIKELDNKTYQDFCNQNHLQGEAGAKVKLGLYHQEELVQVMSFGCPRFTNNYQWEIIRECSKLGYFILGGKERLWSYFVKKYNPENCISYCDFSKFSGDSYLKLEFKFLQLNKPGFVWWDSKINQVFWRNPYKHQEMKEKGYLKIYDAGQLVFVWNK